MLVAHAGGLGWDEALVLGVPLVILVVMQLLARRRRGNEEGEGNDGAEREDA